MDLLRIENLKIETRIGVHAWEQRINQTLLINIDMPSDFSATQDKLEQTVDYDALCKHVTSLVESSAWKLIETVADRVAASIQEVFRVQEITVRVSKPHAVANAGNIHVEVRRGTGLK